MKKQWTLLLIFALLAAGLGGVLWFLSHSEPETSKNSESGAQAGITLLQKDENALQSLTVTNQAGGFTVTFAGKDIHVSGLSDDIPSAEAKLESLRSAVLHVEAQTQIQSVSDPADFGLDQPRASVKASYSDGSSFALDIGADAPGDQGVYCRTGEGGVYVFSSDKVANFLGGLTDLVDTAITKKPEVTSTDASPKPQIKQVTFSGPAHAEPLSIERKPNEDGSAIESYRFLSPRQGDVNSEKEQVIADLLDIRASQVTALSPTDKQLESFQLKEPYSTADFVYDDNGAEQHCVLYASRPANGIVYLMREGRPVVYAATPDSLPWLEMNYGDFVSTRTIQPKMEDVQTVTVSMPEQSLTFQLSGDKEAIQATRDGETVDTTRFKSYYQSLIGVPAEEYTDSLPASESPLLTITYAYRDGTKQADTVRYFAGPTRRVIMQINGGDCFLTREKYLEILLANQKAIQTDGEIQPLV